VIWKAKLSLRTPWRVVSVNRLWILWSGKVGHPEINRMVPFIA
jgi:hypothetical protein